MIVTTGTADAHSHMMRLLSGDTTATMIVIDRFDRFSRSLRTFEVSCDRATEAIRAMADLIKELPRPVTDWLDPPVPAWHQRKVGQRAWGRPQARLPRGRVKAWRSLQDKRIGWGFR